MRFLIGAVLLLGSIVVPALDRSVPPLLASVAWIVGLILMVADGMGRYYARRARRRTEVLARGVPGAVRVHSVRATQNLRKQASVYLTMEVRLPGREPYRAAASRTVAGAGGDIRAGDLLPARVDPARRYDIEIEPGPAAATELESLGVPVEPADIPGIATLDDVVAVGVADDRMMYRLHPAVRLASGATVPVGPQVVLVPAARAGAVTAGAIVPVRLARRPSGGLALAWEWPAP